MKEIIPMETIQRKIYLIRGQKVMLDSDLAKLYEVETKYLTRQVRRNLERFPDEFMFQLNNNGFNDLKRHFGTSSWGGKRKLPYVFTEHGVVMLSSVLNSKKAVQISIAVINAFIKMREYLATHKQILEKLKKHDEDFVIIFNVLKQLTDKPKESPKHKQIGFKP